MHWGNKEASQYYSAINSGFDIYLFKIYKCVLYVRIEILKKYININSMTPSKPGINLDAGKKNNLPC